MKKRWLIVIVALYCFTLASVTFANNPIKLIVNGQEIKPDVPPQIINGRTMVPIRWVAKALGVDVNWDSNYKIVALNTGTEIWKDLVDPSDRKVREAIGVVSRYFAFLAEDGRRGYNELENLATPRALDLNSPNKVVQPFMLTGEHCIPKFDILDVRKTDNNVEVAVRRYIAETHPASISDQTYMYTNEIYTIIWETKVDNDGRKEEIPLIDSARRINSGGSNKLW